MSEKKFISGDDTVYMIDAYNQAITEGLIDSVTIEQFRQITHHQIIDDSGDDLINEQIESAERVADLFRDKKKRKSVLERWFGKKKEIKRKKKK